jgi:hypothetical protein
VADEPTKLILGDTAISAIEQPAGKPSSVDAKSDNDRRSRVVKTAVRS